MGVALGLCLGLEMSLRPNLLDFAEGLDLDLCRNLGL